MTFALRIVAAAAALAGAIPAVSAPATWQVVPAQSRMAFSGTHAGTPFSGNFEQWTATIQFDPAALPQSKAVVSINTASARTGDKLQETTLAGGEWFNPAAFPRATFTTTRITAAGPNRYVADGILQIKNKRAPVRLPFTLAIKGATATMTGKTSIDRTTFDIGMTSDPKGAWVSKSIGLEIRLVARRR